MTEKTPEPQPLLPAWETLRADYIADGLPGRCVVRTEPKAELFVEPGGRRFGAVLALPPDGAVPTSPLTHISLAEVQIDGVRCVELASDASDLFATFYLLLSDLMRAVTEENVPPIAAIDACVARWQALLDTAALLTEERRLGLLGELWFLARLMEVRGSEALAAWTGPLGQSHDFRWGPTEFEVKATAAARRVHMINGLRQLEPSQDCSLFLVSLRFVAAGAGGETLPEAVDRIAASLESDARDRFLRTLETIGYRSSDAAHYARRLRLGDAARLIPVEKGCPRLTPAALTFVPTEYATGRIIDLNYRVDVEGLGYGDGEAAFLEILPNGQG
ncbi:PD-(D/E)XK motif protein [Sphingomonas sp.]|uniref:PD-(D/E)XK motif protein n=1 Tax=Sphingomonas sp. TaxID=28214 RepID=UPI001B0BF074|nr:PD-(D/E)XK motif protein [Sphingomonas sp.]MBO9712473.1 PD-(D/E)XK motif protein [Sphingomonas sp.]